MGLHKNWSTRDVSAHWSAGMSHCIQSCLQQTACFGVWFVLRCSHKGISSPDTIHTNAMLCVLLSVLPKCFNIWGHIPAFLQPCPRAGKPGGTKQKLNWGDRDPLGVVYSDTWVCSHSSLLNIHPHFPSAPFPFHSHAHPHGAWALLSAWLTVSAMDCHLPGLGVCSPWCTHHPQCLDNPLCCYHQLPLSGLCPTENPPPEPLLWLQHPVGSGANSSCKWRYHCRICIKTPYLLWNSPVLQNHSHWFLSLPFQICIDGT